MTDALPLPTPQWPSAPTWMSYSSLSDVEACPRRWALSRARYPDIWEETGYPDLVTYAALEGLVVHDAVERLTKELVAAGCSDVGHESAVRVMRELGGFRTLVDDAIENRIYSLAGNPRMSPRRDDLRTQLRGSRTKIRSKVQSMLAALGLATGSGTRGRAEPGLVWTGELPDGAFPELPLQSTELRLRGRADLVNVSQGEVEIVDFKTGQPSPSHEDQLTLYAVLFARRDGARGSQAEATRLTIQYPDRSVEVPVPTGSEIDAMAKTIQTRIVDATSSMSEEPPRAVPTADNCAFCSVRHMCDDYWTDDLTTDDAAEWCDVQALLTAENGPRSCAVRIGSMDGLLLTPSDMVLPIGRTVRVLGTRRVEDEEAAKPTWRVTIRSEVFVLPD